MSVTTPTKQHGAASLYRGIAIGLAGGILYGHFVQMNPLTWFLAAMLCFAFLLASEGYERLRVNAVPDEKSDISN